MGKSLGDRMKSQYENRTRYSLPRRTYTIIRLDGKAFHTFTRHCVKPFDGRLSASLDQATIALCNRMQGVCFAYLQSDEISLLLTDFNTPQTDAWFDGNIQKITSVSASVMTAHFNAVFAKHEKAYFDSRVFTIPDRTEVQNYFIWRQKDWNRNSINMLGQHHFSHSKLQGKNTSEVQDMLHGVGVNWNNCTSWEKNGRLIEYSDGMRAWDALQETPTLSYGCDFFERNIPKIGEEVED